jgi:hypothetical protein
VPDQTGLTNYVDNSKHIGAVGVGVEIGQVPHFTKGPVRLDLAVQLQSLVNRTTVKDPGLVNDADGDGILSYPAGYPFSGSYTSGGRTWAMMGTLEADFGNLRPGPPQRKPRADKPDRGSDKKSKGDAS